MILLNTINWNNHTPILIAVTAYMADYIDTVDRTKTSTVYSKRLMATGRVRMKVLLTPTTYKQLDHVISEPGRISWLNLDALYDTSDWQKKSQALQRRRWQALRPATAKT